MKDEACPVVSELVIEIISLGQTFGEMTEKAIDYLTAGVSRVWIVDPRAKNITVFAPNALPKTYRGDTAIAEPLLSGLRITTQQIFVQAVLIS